MHTDLLQPLATGVRLFVGARIYDKAQLKSGITLMVDQPGGVIVFWRDGSESGRVGLDMANIDDCILMDDGHATPETVGAIIARCAPTTPTIEEAV